MHGQSGGRLQAAGHSLFQNMCRVWIILRNFAVMHQKIKTSVIVRFIILGIIWLGLTAYILAHAQITLYTIFVIIASAIIIFVPMYKKYVKK